MEFAQSQTNFPFHAQVVFITFMVVTWYFQPYMFPIILLLVFVKNYFIRSYLDENPTHGPRSGGAGGGDQEDAFDDDEFMADEKEEEKEEKKSLKAKLQAVQEVTAMVQVRQKDITHTDRKLF